MFTNIPDTRPSTPLLVSVENPSDLKALDQAQLQQLADELRAFLLFSVGQTGGHFGAGLGAVELTIALHSVLDIPKDDLIWDVGHQAYPHKILTGRREAMLSIRQHGGLAPFPSREESLHDSFGVGHSSTSISAALGMAIAKRAQSPQSHTVAVIGDGAMTAGMAFEALNHAAHCKVPMLIILNDNTMSISENVGGLAHYLEQLWQTKAKQQNKVSSTEPANIFEALGIFYSGPIDGHDIPTLQNNIKRLLQKHVPCLLHVKTIKGKGFGPAVEDPIGYHALSKIEPKIKTAINKAEVSSSHPNKPIAQRKYQDIFGAWICEKAAQDIKTFAITPAMREGSGLVDFSNQFPNRFLDVAIAEQHAVTLAAGLACKGMKPVVAIYSTFLQRAYDQVVHDVAIQNLDVTFAIDRAGIVGEDGATHTGAFDINFLRCLPNFIIAAPSSESECRALLETAYNFKGPAAIRYPRGNAAPVQAPYSKQVPHSSAQHSNQKNMRAKSEIGKSQILRDGKEVCILNFGALLNEAIAVSEKKHYGLVDMRWIKPLDEMKLIELSKIYTFFITLEDGMVAGGAGSAVSEFFNIKGLRHPILQLGIPDKFVDHGQRSQILKSIGLDEIGIESSIFEWLKALGKI